MSKMKEYLMSKENNSSIIPPEFEASDDYHSAMAEMAYFSSINDIVNLMLTYGKPTVMRDIEARYAAANVMIWGKH